MPLRLAASWSNSSPAPLQRHAVGKVAVHDPLGGAVDLFDPRQQVAAQHRAADQPGDERRQPRPHQGQLDPLAEQGGVADVVRHQQAVPVGDDDQRALGRPLAGTALVVVLDLDVKATGPGATGVPAGQPVMLPASGWPSRLVTR